MNGKKIFLLFATFAITSAISSICFVEYRGTDSDLCGARTSPCKTITKCIDNNQESVQIIVLNGTYHEELCDVIINFNFSLTAENASETQITLSCNSSRIFEIAQVRAGKVSFSGITFAGNRQVGHVDAGGCIYASSATDSSVYITDCTFQGCSASVGGAIATNWLEPFQLIIESSTFQNNSAVGGGAISAANLTITSSKFFYNSASSEGGALLIHGLARLNDVSMQGNVASSGAGNAINTVNLSNQRKFISITMQHCNIEELSQSDSYDIVLYNISQFISPMRWESTTVGSIWLGDGTQEDADFQILGADIRSLKCSDQAFASVDICHACSVDECRSCHSTGLCQETSKDSFQCFSASNPTLSCPNGACHMNSTGVSTCTDTPPDDKPWYKEGWFTAVIVGTMALAVVVLGVVAAVYKRMHPENYEYTRLD